MENLTLLWESTGLYNFTGPQAIMMAVGFLLLFLAIKKGFEPLLLLPIGFGAILSNIPVAGMTEEGGVLFYLYGGIKSGMFPLLIFMGVGAMTDFGPMLANPKTLFLGAAAQFGIFATLFGALALNTVPGMNFDLKQAAAIAIIGGADGPTAIYVASKLAPNCWVPSPWLPILIWHWCR
jgi:carboxybiotin decarboxylase